MMKKYDVNAQCALTSYFFHYIFYKHNDNATPYKKNPSDTLSTTNHMCTGLGSNVALIKVINNEIHINTFFTDAILKLRSAAGDDIVDCTPGAICIDRARPIVLLDLSSVNWESSESNVKSNFMSTPSSL